LLIFHLVFPLQHSSLEVVGVVKNIISGLDLYKKVFINLTKCNYDFFF